MTLQSQIVKSHTRQVRIGAWGGGRGVSLNQVRRASAARAAQVRVPRALLAAGERFVHLLSPVEPPPSPPFPPVLTGHALSLPPY